MTAAVSTPKNTPDGLSKPKMSAVARADRRLAIALLIPTAVLLLVFEIYPLAIAVRDALFNVNFYSGQSSFVGLGNFAAVLQDPETIASFGRTFEYIVGSLALQVPAALLTAMLLNQGLRGQLVWRGLNLFPYMVPAVVAAAVFRFGFNDLYGIVNYLLVNVFGVVGHSIPFLSDPGTVMLSVILVSSWNHTPFMTIALLARLQTVPRDLLEAASVDGAGPVARFRYITLPWLLPVLLIVMLLRTIWTGVEFDFPYLVAEGGPLHGSTVVAIQIYSLYTQELNIGEAAALSLCVGVVMLLAAGLYLWAYGRVETAI